jgi:hypothetical protein
MYFNAASKLVVASGTDAFTQAVNMEGANAAMVEATLFVKGSGNVTVTVQGSNDLENWDTTGISGGTITFTAVGYDDATATGIAYRFIRLKISQATSGSGIIALGINTAQL